MYFPDNKGFTLIEVVIAIGIFSIGILATLGLQGAIVKGNANAHRVSDLVNWGSDRVEILRSMPYDSDNNARDDDGDGVKDEADEFFRDGTGTDAGVAGLNNVPAKKPGDPVEVADNTVTSPDGNYIVYWNVAENYPGPKMKTVRVIVRNRLMNSDSAFTTVKVVGK